MSSYYFFDFISQEMEILCFCLLLSNFLNVNLRTKMKNFLLASMLNFPLLLINTVFDNSTITAIIYLIFAFVQVYIVFHIAVHDLVFLYLLSFIMISCYEGFLSIFIPATFLSYYSQLLQIIFLIILSLILIFIFPKFHLSQIYELVKKGNNVIKLLIINSFCVSIIIVIIYKTNFHNFINISLTVFLCLFLICFVNIDFFYTQRLNVKNAQALVSYESYLPIIDKLIEEIRSAQHDYNNRLTSIKMLSLSYDNIEDFRAAIDENIVNFNQDLMLLDLLKINLHLLSGLMISKYKTALLNGYTVRITIRNYFFQIPVPEYELVDICGVLLDNCIENSPAEYPVFIEIASENNRFKFITQNYGPTVDSSFCEKIFTKGYSTKQNLQNHGFGLYNLKKTVEKYDGEISVYNILKNTQQYICFEITV